MAKGAEVSLRDADHALREIREALEHPGHFPTRKDRDAALARLDAARKHLYPLLQQLREDAEWKRWVNITVQEELCAEAEALLAEEDLEQAANALRELDAALEAGEGGPEGPGGGPVDALQGRARPGQVAHRRLLREAGRGAGGEPEEEGGPLREGRGPRGVHRLAEDRGGAAQAPGRVEGDRPRAARGVAEGVGALPQALRPLLHALAGAPQPAQPRVGREPREEGGPVREGRGPPGVHRLGGRPRPSSSGCRPSGARSAR